MDLGCIDLGCIDKHIPETNDHSPGPGAEQQLYASGEKPTSASKIGKNKSPRGNGHSPSLNVLSRFTSHIRKPSRRKSPPLNWFPRKKVDSYLKRKIKMLQEVDGMNLTLDETLGDSNPHYSRVLREKIAAREAANKAMEARKAALVEASWCRILHAARIHSKEAEALLLKAEKTAAEAFEAASALGVIMYDKPNFPGKQCQIETSTANGGSLTTHTVTASFETAFEVDKEVAAAVKTAFLRLLSCPSFDKAEFRDLLRKISQNPDISDGNQELSEFSSECRSEIEVVSENNVFVKDPKLPIPETRQSFEKLSMAKLADMMLGRLKGLKEDELSSLATIVATCGLNAALAEAENDKLQNPGSNADSTSNNFLRRMSSAGSGRMELPSLDKFLVKHTSKLEREVQEAKNSRRNDSRDGNLDISDRMDRVNVNSEDKTMSSEDVSDLGSILVKHSSKLEKEIAEAKRNVEKKFGSRCYKLNEGGQDSSDNIPDLGSILIKHSSKLEREVQDVKRNAVSNADTDSDEAHRLTAGVVRKKKGEVQEVPSLDKFLVKHVSRLEKEVQEAKNRRKIDQVEDGSLTSVREEVSEKENKDLNREENREEQPDGEKECSINLPLPNTAIWQQESLMKNHKMNPNLQQPLLDRKAGRGKIEDDSLDKIFVKPLHRLEREKLEASSLEWDYGTRMRQNKPGSDAATECEGLDKVLVKHVSRLEKEKMQLGLKGEEFKVKKSGRTNHSGTNEEGGLDKVLVKHVSRLEKEKMQLGLKEEEFKVKKSDRNNHSSTNVEGGLDQILVKHKSRLEREKMAALNQEPGQQVRSSVSSHRVARDRELQETWGGLSLGNSMRPHLSKLERDKAALTQEPGQQVRSSVSSHRVARDRELQETWGGLSLGNSMRPHLSKLERDKAAWIKAEEEERRRAMREM